MYPEGLVGVDPVCVLGLNVNKGMRIQLRLRTDDMEGLLPFFPLVHAVPTCLTHACVAMVGFRNLTSIKKVLYHEMAHNVFLEHDSDFYQLMRQVNFISISMYMYMYVYVYVYMRRSPALSCVHPLLSLPCGIHPSCIIYHIYRSIPGSPILFIGRGRGPRPRLAQIRRPRRRRRPPAARR